MGTARLVLILAFAIGGTSVARAETSDGGSFVSNQLVGQIKTVEPRKQSITVSVNGHDQSYAMGNSTTVFVEGRLGALQDLKAGQDVRAAFDNHNGQRSIRWIEVTPPATKAPQNTAATH